MTEPSRADAIPDNDFDGPWKEVLDLYLEEVLAFFFPEAHRDIDWSRGYEGLDKELQLVVPEGERAAQAVDKLVKVSLHSAEEAWILIHLEVQSQPESSFEERMFRYHARLYDHHRQEIVSLAILGDDRPTWRPTDFGYGRWGCAVRFNFPAIKLLDFTAAALEASTNLCAIVVLAHRAAQQTRHDPAGRAATKLGLIRQLYRRGLTREQISDLYRFIDWLLRLPKGLDDETWLAIRAIEEEQAVTYVTTAERYGLEQGRMAGLLAGIEAILDLKFGAAGVEVMPLLREIDDIDRLDVLLQQIKTAASLAEVRAFAQAGE